ncbi:MAG: two-component system sensor histidine kinase/response regulator [Candidatus Paceibacteria bacterium]|jgi:two-component system sensor histidine kinase/response regulator
MSKKSVLVIEDSTYLAESLKDMLNIKDFEAIIAPNGREGVVLATEQHPDLILLDIHLPDIDGYEVYRRIRSDEWGANAKIMVLTASESAENISKNIDLPNDSILFKPDWSIKDLLEKIEEKVNS